MNPDEEMLVDLPVTNRLSRNFVEHDEELINGLMGVEETTKETPEAPSTNLLVDVNAFMMF